MLNRYFITVLLLATTFIFGQKSVPQDEVKAKIEVEKVENNIKITGTAENLTNIIKSASYKLSVIKNSIATNGNKSNNSQEGLFTLKPSEKIKLSTTQVNIDDDDEVIIMLLFYNEEKQIISKDRLVFNSEKKK